MNGLYDYLKSLPPDMKVSELPAKVLIEEAPIDKKKFWGKPKEETDDATQKR